MKNEKQDHKHFRATIEQLRADLANAHECEDRPLTSNELETLITQTRAVLGWSRDRIITEGVLRLREALESNEPFQPLTPPATRAARRGKYLRRYASIEAMVLGRPKRHTTQRDPRRDSLPVDPRREPEE